MVVLLSLLASLVLWWWVYLWMDGYVGFVLANASTRRRIDPRWSRTLRATKRGLLINSCFLVIWLALPKQFVFARYSPSVCSCDPWVVLLTSSRLEPGSAFWGVSDAMMFASVPHLRTLLAI